MGILIMNNQGECLVTKIDILLGEAKRVVRVL